MTGLAERTALLDVIDKGRAHLTFDQIIEAFPLDQINTCPPNVPYSFWGVLEHLRICIHLSIDYAVGESFVALEWPPHVARAGVEHICQALARAGNRQSAYELLRRDKHARALLDVNRTAWSALLRALLGHPNPAYAATASGRGILLRLLIGESREALLRDDDLVLMISLAAPKPGGR